MPGVKVAVVLHGDAPTHEDLKLLDACDAIVCADGAAGALLAADRPPTRIVGDLDSLDEETYKWADALDVPVDSHPADKDHTDGELALQHALDMNPDSILILGGHGGRTGMFLANLQLLRRCHDRDVEAIMVGDGESVRYISAGGEYNLAGKTGRVLNILPVDGHAVVSMEGTEFDGKAIRLGARSARGVSNRVKADGAKVSVHEGTVLVTLERLRDRHDRD